MEKKEKWKEEFDEMFPSITPTTGMLEGKSILCGTVRTASIKRFISKILEEQKKELEK